MTYEFKAWPKTPRYANEEMTITEKIDGTNAAVCIFPNEFPGNTQVGDGFIELLVGDTWYVFGAQSRNRMITPEKGSDNAGFAAWAWDNGHALIQTLGYGRHYGEWWGSGIQGGYGLPKGEKRFSLFDVWRWNDGFDVTIAPEQLYLVPILYQGAADQDAVTKSLLHLEAHGSVASPGYDRPEGVIVTYKLTRQSYKAFVKDDGIPKSLKEGK